jgi:rhodanese-related sulfurtransferase
MAQAVERSVFHSPTTEREMTMADQPGGTLKVRDLTPEGSEIVFTCRSGRRSVTASLAAQEQGFAYDAHLAGGLLAWKAAGLPTET